MNWWHILHDLFDMALRGTAEVSRRLAFVPRHQTAGVSPGMSAVEVYLHSLKRLTSFVFLFPIPLLLIGMVNGAEPLIAFSGLFWAAATIVLLLVASPLGVLLETLLGGIRGSGERYVKFVLTVLLTELTFTLFLIVFPIRNNPAAIPILLLAAAVLSVLSVLGVTTILNRRIIGVFAGMQFVYIALSLSCPHVSEGLSNLTHRADATIAAVLTSSPTPTPTTSPTRYPICPEDKGLPVILTRESAPNTLRLRPDCLSREVVSEDVGVDIVGTAYGWHEYHFADGSIVLAKSEEEFYFERPLVPRFRLRGEGLATVKAVTGEDYQKPMARRSR